MVSNPRTRLCSTQIDNRASHVITIVASSFATPASFASRARMYTSLINLSSAACETSLTSTMSTPARVNRSRNRGAESVVLFAYARTTHFFANDFDASTILAAQSACE